MSIDVADKLRLADRVAAALAPIPNLVAIALGGSLARGTHHTGSDIDIGLYYRAATPFPVDAVWAVARSFATGSEPVVTGFGEWGLWVNGGAWIETSLCKIDLLYRDLDLVERTVREAQAGTWRHDFDQQPPFGFRSVIYLAETAACKPLHDPDDELAELKAAVATYPPELKRRIVADCLWGAEFSLLFAGDFARRGEVANVAGCLTRVHHYLVQALFALNEVYFIGDKGTGAMIEAFDVRPDDYVRVATEVLGRMGMTAEELGASVDRFRGLFEEIAALSGGEYRPRFILPGS